MKILVVHPGHAHGTVDVFTGVCAGLRANDIDVIPLAWDRMLAPLIALVQGAQMSGVFPAKKAEQFQRLASWLASGDVVPIAFDEAVDAVIVVNGLLFPAERALVMRKLGIPVACVGTEAPYFERAEREIAPFYSHWFTNERTALAGFQTLTNAHYLPHAYNPEVHHPDDADPSLACDVVFVGGGFPERKRLFAGVDWTGIRQEILGTLWHLDLDDERLIKDAGRGGRYAEGAIPNELTTAYHRSARIALNLHRRMGTIGGEEAPEGAQSLNPRALEIPAAGGFMLCDDERPEVFEVFGDSAAVFRAWDSVDLERQVRYWLKHPDERERQRQAQREAVRPHHWGNRARQILECLL